MKNIFFVLASFLLRQIEASHSFRASEIANGAFRQQLARVLSLSLLWGSLGLSGVLFLVSGIVTLLLGLAAQYDLNGNIAINGAVWASITMLVLSGAILIWCGRRLAQIVAPLAIQPNESTDSGSGLINLLEIIFQKRA